MPFVYALLFMTKDKKVRNVLNSRIKYGILYIERESHGEGRPRCIAKSSR